MAAYITDEAKKVRERMYMIILENISDAEVDDLHILYQANVPTYIKKAADEIPYRILTAIACDLGKLPSIGTLICSTP